MAKRPVHTLIFLGTHRTDRVDLGPGPDFPLLGEHHHASVDVEEPEERLAASLAALPRVGKKVWVLWEGAHAQFLDLPAAAVNGLDREQLSGALAFEAETFTGVSITDSALDGVPQRNTASVLPDHKRFWVTQVAASTRDKFEDAIADSQSVLAGIAHPAGLPRPGWDVAPHATPKHDWWRVEVWDQLTFVLHGRTDGTVETKAIRSMPGSDTWADELPNQGPLTWMGPGPVTRVGPDGRRVSLESADGIPLEPERLDLPPDAAAVDWLRAWAAELTAKPRRVPVVESVNTVSPNRKFYLVGGVLASIILAACLAHSGMLSVQASTARTRADQLEAARAPAGPSNVDKAQEQLVKDETEKLRPKLADLDKRLKELTQESDKAQKTAEDAAARLARLRALQAIHRPAILSLLGALADAEREENPAELVFKEVRQDDSGGLRLKGLCRRASAADAFTTKLGTQIAEDGWRVGAAQKRMRADQVGYDFEILLTPAVLQEAGYPGAPLVAPRPGVASARRAEQASSRDQTGAGQR